MTARSKAVPARERNLLNGEIGRRIAARRHELKLSQTDLGRAVGITYQSIQKYENGNVRISTEKLIALCRALKLEPRSFFRELDRFDVQAMGFTENSSPPYQDTSFLNRDAAKLVQYFEAIHDKEIRKQLIEFAAVLAKQPAPAKTRAKRASSKP